jgi:hypothetical protein
VRFVALAVVRRCVGASVRRCVERRQEGENTDCNPQLSGGIPDSFAGMTELRNLELKKEDDGSRLVVTASREGGRRARLLLVHDRGLLQVK